MNNRRTFFQYVIPSVLSFALSGVYAIVDGFFVGNSIGDAGLSAINIAYPVTAVLQAVGTGLGMGGAVKYSILKAEGNAEKAREYIAAATWLMLIFSAALTGAVFFASKSILSALGASGELLTLGDEYIRVIALGAVLQIFGTSMNPNLQEGEIVVSVKSPQFKTGDIIAFYYNNRVLVKRIIGCPGDSVVITDSGDVYVNNTLLDEPYLTEKSYGTADIEYPYTVPQNSFFILGDHRESSVDSRSSLVGCVEKEEIIGKIVFRVWPIKRIGFVD